MTTSYFTRHIAVIPLKVTEGGGSRDNALAKLLKDAGTKQIVILRHGKISQVMGFLKIVFSLFIWRKERIFLHYTIFTSTIGAKNVSKKIFRTFIYLMLLKSSRRNLIYFEVNDLPYEQAIDLELGRNNLNNFDRLLFSIKNIFFIFASEEMRRYAIAKYGISENKAISIINGAWPVGDAALAEPLENNKECGSLNLLYAGTLNKGRQIELMIEIVKKTPHRLYLMGEGGDWIDGDLLMNRKLIKLGALSEEEAQQQATLCDLGLIPYDSSRMYYNMCYPTKASFYLSAGIPTLSTCLTELNNHFSFPHFIFLSIDQWANFLNAPDVVSIVNKARNDINRSGVEKILWPNIWREFLIKLEKLCVF